MLNRTRSLLEIRRELSLLFVHVVRFCRDPTAKRPVIIVVKLPVTVSNTLKFKLNFDFTPIEFF